VVGALDYVGLGGAKGVGVGGGLEVGCWLLAPLVVNVCTSVCVSCVMVDKVHRVRRPRVHLEFLVEKKVPQGCCL
jgi:hypothetical protein